MMDGGLSSQTNIGWVVQRAVRGIVMNRIDPGPGGGTRAPTMYMLFEKRGARIDAHAVKLPSRGMHYMYKYVPKAAAPRMTTPWRKRLNNAERDAQAV